MFNNLYNYHTLIFDFDGVFTNNKVYLDENGLEQIRCDRGDGLGIGLLNSFIRKNNFDLDVLILSKEKNKVVNIRAKKLGIKCFNGVDNKLGFIKTYLSKRFNRLDGKEKGLIYVGNDLNDLEAILFAGYSICPKDAHKIIRENCDKIIDYDGGNSFVRNCIEYIINLENIDINEIVNLMNYIY